MQLVQQKLGELTEVAVSQRVRRITCDNISTLFMINLLDNLIGIEKPS